MGFLDIFTGAGQARAQKTLRGLQGQTFERNLDTFLTGNTNARNESINGTNAAIGTLTGSRDAAGKVIGAGGEKAAGLIDQGVASAKDALGKARRSFGQAGSAYDPLAASAKRFEPAVGLYADAAGLNGADGLTRARQSFGDSLRNSFEFDQGLQAINRARAARGGGTINSGNIDRDTQIYGQNLANSKTDAFMDRLLAMADRTTGLQSAVAAGQAGAANNIGNTYNQEAGYLNAGGANKAQLAADTAKRIAGLTSNAGAQIAGLQTGVADRLSNLAQNRATGEIGLRSDYTGGLGQSLLAERNARDAASQKSLDYGIKAAQIAASIASGGLGGIPGLGSLGSLGKTAITGSLPLIGPVPRTRASALPLV